MANLFTSNSHSDLISDERANTVEGSSLESTSADSESASSCITKIEVNSTSSEPKAVEDTQINVNFEIAKENEDGCMNQSSSSVISSNNTTYYIAERQIGVSEEEGQNVNENFLDISPQERFHRDEDGNDDDDYDDEKEIEGSYDEDTISSEAVVDDIELILMPETVQDLPPTDLSPQLVRVTELRRSAEYEADVFRDNDDEDTDQESDFRKMGSEDEDEDGDTQRMKQDRRLLSSAGDEDEEPSSSHSQDIVRIRGNSRSSGKVNSGVQTDITALDNSASILYEFRRKSSGKSSTKLLGVTGKRLNWKSELTLLPSKTKIRTTGLTGYESMNYQDQYSPRVAKFTSQDTLNSSAHFLKPSTLYRTRNLSRNLNQCVSSESTLGLSMTGLASTESPRYRDRMSSSTSAANFKESTAMHSYSAYHISCSMNRRQPSVSTSSARNFRSSLPDLSSSSKASTDNKDPRKTYRSMKYHKSSSGYKLNKKSSSDDETSSLIDESERCLRSSIDLLLTDDLPCPGEDLSCRSTGFGTSGFAGHGYYSSRRSCSQPILNDDGDYGDLRDPTMGSPFLPRKLSDMRCSRWAKVILPNGQVTVVAVKEMDELRDCLTIHTDTGCILSLPFRKVVFAWKIKR